jgi:hypothetical protein
MTVRPELSTQAADPAGEAPASAPQLVSDAHYKPKRIPRPAHWQNTTTAPLAVSAAPQALPERLAHQSSSRLRFAWRATLLLLLVNALLFGVQRLQQPTEISSASAHERRIDLLPPATPEKSSAIIYRGQAATEEPLREPRWLRDE